MLPAGNGPGYNYFSQPLSQNIQGQPQLSAQMLQIPNLYQNQSLINSQLPLTNNTQTYQLTPGSFSYFPPNQEQFLAQNTSGAYPTNNPHQILRTISTSDEEMENTELSKENPWQIFTKTTKRRKIRTNTQQTDDSSVVTLSNKYSLLTNPQENNSNTNPIELDKTPKPPPIFVYGVMNLPQMKQKLAEVAEEEQYVTKSLINNTIKITTKTPDTYRKLAKFMRENQIIHHTYQPKDERAFRVVIKHLHHSIPINEIKAELTEHGHQVRNIINAKHRTTKEPMNLFFVDLEPSENNKDIYNLKHLQHNSILIEPPRTRNSNIVQCMRCQMYGHTKTYCTRPFVCVKCGGDHSTASCKKSKDTPATCALCGGKHPANYRGCEYYHNLLKTKTINHRPLMNQVPPLNSQIHFPNIRSPAGYSTNAWNTVPQTANTTDQSSSLTLNKFLEEFKSMFSQLIQQNSMVLNMLTMLISKQNNG